MSWLLDENFMLASRWATHVDHRAVLAWLDSIENYYTCAISELGFLRVSKSPAYNATWEDALESLKSLQRRAGYGFLADDVTAVESPKTGWRDTTDAHLIARAKRHRLTLATLDGKLISQQWARDIAIKPSLT